MTSSWRRLSLAPDEQDRASRTVADIVSQLDGRPQSDPSFAGGGAGIAVLLAYLAEADDSDAHAVQAVGLAEDALAIAVNDHGAGLYGGLTGPAWALAHLDGWLVDLSPGDPNDAVDQAMLDLLGNSTWEREYDLVGGLIGLGVYALERLPRPEAVLAVERVVAQLAQLAEAHQDGITWYTRPELLPEHQRVQAPQGYYNLGVAHGVPGVIGLLASIIEADVARPTAGELLAGAVEWTLGQQLPAGGFAAWVGPGTSTGRARSAWCYGEPGLSAMLLRAATALGRTDWATGAVQLAVDAAERPLTDSGVVDAGLCHGAAGLAQIYNRMWQQTQDDRLHSAACRWLNHALDLLPSTPKLELLEGRAGVALALLAANGTEPACDRALLLSGPVGE